MDSWLLRLPSPSIQTHKVPEPEKQVGTPEKRKLTEKDNKKDQKKRKSGFNLEWKKSYPWLLQSSISASGMEMGMLCCLCQLHKPKADIKIWVTEPCSSITEQAVKRHQGSEMHQLSQQKQLARSSMGVGAGLLKHESLQRKAFVGGLRTMYWLCKEEVAHTTKYEKLLDFTEHMGATYLKHLDQGGNANYRSFRMQQEMVGVIGNTIRERILVQMRQGPFSLMIDETTDVSILKQLIIYGRYMHEYEVKTSFIGLLDLPDGKAATIHLALVDFCQKMELDMTNLVGLGSDGASVMVGVRNGVTALLKRDHPQVKGVHCMAHRLALASSQAAKDIPYLEKFKSTLTQLFYFYQNSPVRMAGLKAIQTILDEPKLKCVKATDVRWLSHDRAITNLRQTLTSVLASLERESAERHDATAKGLLTFIRKLKFVCGIMMFSDILPKLSSLSKVFQTTNVDLAVVSLKVEATSNAIASLKGGMGTHMQSVAKYVEELGEREIAFDDTKVSTFIHSTHDKFIGQILENLSSRFSDLGILERFSIFDPCCLEQDGDVFLEEDQLQKIEELCDSFEGLNSTATLEEWQLLRQLLVGKLKNHTFQQVLGHVVRNHGELMPNLHKAATIAQVLPVSTADCERGFSALKRIKTPGRNQLGEAMLESLMLISIQGPEHVSSSLPAIMEGAADEWAKAKNRRLII